MVALCETGDQFIKDGSVVVQDDLGTLFQVMAVD